MEVNNEKNTPEYKVGYLIGRIVGLSIVVALGLVTLLLIGGLGYKLIVWMFGL